MGSLRQILNPSTEDQIAFRDSMKEVSEYLGALQDAGIEDDDISTWFQDYDMLRAYIYWKVGRESK